MATAQRAIMSLVVILGLGGILGCPGEKGGEAPMTTTATPQGGNFPSYSPPAVTLRTNKAATIYYSTNGVPPESDKGNTFSGDSPVTLGPFRKNTVLKFYAVDNDGTQEVVRTETYTIIQPPVTTSDPPGGAYGIKPLYVKLETKADPPASPQYIYYTIDGTTPTITSAGFDSPAYIALLNEGPTLLRFFATDSVGNVESSVKTELYIIDTIPPVTMASPSGCQPTTTGGQCPIQDLTGCTPFTGPAVVTLSTNESATIYYSTDGQDPNINNTVDKGGNTFSGNTSVQVPINVSTTLKYFAVDLVGNAGAIRTAFYKVGTGPISRACPKGGSYAALPFTVTIVASPQTPTATIFYTLDGTLPTGGTAISQPAAAVITFTADGISVLTFQAYNGFWEDQSHSETYVFDTTPPVTTTVPCGVTFTGSGQVTLSANEPATIFYTLNGLPPSPGTAYTFSGTTPASLTITRDTTVKFFARDTAGNNETPPGSCSYQVVQEYNEDFTSTQFEDSPATTADWNTGLGQLLLKRLTPVMAGQFTTVIPSQGVSASGGNAYIADATGLRVFDVSNPAQPNLLATYASFLDPFWSVTVSGNYAYAGSSSGLVILNIANAASPQLVGQINIGNPLGTYVQDVEVSGDYALLADQGQGLFVIGLTVIGSPRILAQIDLLPSDARDVALSGNYALVADGANGLKIVDINVADPAFALLKSAFTTAGVANAVAVSGPYAFVGLTSGYIQAVDFSNPLFPVASGNPVQVSTFSINKISIRGDYAYCSTGTGIQVVDISSPSALITVGGLQGIGASNSIYVSGHHAYMANGTGGLQIIRIADPINISQAGQVVTTTSSGNNAATYGGIGLLADGSNGLRVIDLSHPNSPVLLATVPTMTNAARVSVLGGNGSSHYIMVSDAGANGPVQVVDISDPSSPVLAVAFNPAGIDGVKDMVFFGQSTTASPPTVTAAYALMAQGPSGVRSINITDPLNPAVVSTLAPLNSNATRIVVNGDTAYVADGGGGLRVVNISNIRNLALVRTVTSTNAQDLAMSGPYLYMADGTGGVKVYRIDNPQNPIQIGSFTQATQAQGIGVAGPFAYVADGTNGLRVLNVTFPNNPVLVQTFTTTQARGVAVWGDYALVADGLGGMRVLRTYKNLTDYLPSGIGQSITVNSTQANIPWAQLSVTQNLTATTSSTYYLSNNGGQTWEPVAVLGSPHTFAGAGSSLRWKAVLSTTDPRESPTVDTLRIVYTFAP